MPSDLGLRSLRDIVDNIDLATEFIGHATVADLIADRKTFYAVVRCLEIVSEASRRLDPEIFERQAHIPWKLVRGSGNLYRHEYGDVDPELVLVTVHDSLPVLRAAVAAELATYGSE